MTNFNFSNILILTVGIILLLAGWKNKSLPDLLSSMFKGDFSFINAPSSSVTVANNIPTTPSTTGDYTGVV